MKILLEIFFRLMRSLLFIFEEKIDRDARNERKEKKNNGKSSRNFFYFLHLNIKLYIFDIVLIYYQ